MSYSRYIAEKICEAKKAATFRERRGAPHTPRWHRRQRNRRLVGPPVVANLIAVTLFGGVVGGATLFGGVLVLAGTGLALVTSITG